jgi:hypothetical protein
MAFDNDVNKLLSRLDSWGRSNPIRQDDYAIIEQAIKQHASDRNSLFEALLSQLKRDTDIQGGWSNICDKGLEIHEKLNSVIGSRLNGGGFRDMNMSDYYEGEKAVWSSARTGTVAAMAEIIFDIAKNDVELIKALEEDIKKAREDAKVVDEMVKVTFGDIREKVRAVTVEAAAQWAGKALALIPYIGEKLSGPVTAAASAIMGGSQKVRELARRKSAFKSVLVGNRDKIDKVKDVVGENTIRSTWKNAEDIANNWKSTGSRGDYAAQDWESFASSVREILKNKSEPAIEKAKNLFENMRPLYVEAINTAFLTLSSDPSTLENFKGQLSDDDQKMLVELAKDDEVINALRDSDPKKKAIADMAKVRDDLAKAIKELKDSIVEMERQMKI